MAKPKTKPTRASVDAYLALSHRLRYSRQGNRRLSCPGPQAGRPPGEARATQDVEVLLVFPAPGRPRRQGPRGAHVRLGRRPQTPVSAYRSLNATDTV